MSAARALIIGSRGQDGHYLADLLFHAGYTVFGIDSGDAGDSSKSLAEYATCDLRQPAALTPHLLRFEPAEVYYLAAQNFSSADTRLRTTPVVDVFSVNLSSLAVCLTELADNFPHSKLFYAGSCHVFGTPDEVPQHEGTPHKPDTPYGITKSAGVQLCKFFRDARNFFAVAGILYNHESARRREPFVTAQIAAAAAAAAAGRTSRLTLRDVNAVVDWGAASDYVEAMWLSLQHRTPDDYIIASGIGRTVSDFARTAFEHVGLDWRDFVVTNDSPDGTRSARYVGDASRITAATGWRPRTSFKDLVCSMVDVYRLAPNGVPTPS